MNEKMFCFQCEQTYGGSGCTVSGVCGKNPAVAKGQDLLTGALIGLIMLFCSPIEIPWPGRKQNEPINKGLSRLRRPEVTHTYARRAQKVLTHHKS